MTERRKDVRDLPVPPIVADDVLGALPFSGGEIFFCSRQGQRETNEDFFLCRAGAQINAAAPALLLHEMFTTAKAATQALRAGAAVTAAIVTPDMKLNLAFIGDCPAMLFLHDKQSGAVEVIRLEHDHHAYMPAEKQRVESSGGTVSWNGLVDGRLTLSRAFGDANIKGVSRDFEMTETDLAPFAGKDIYLCVASDGLFGEHMDERDYVPVFERALKENAGENLAGILAGHAGKRDSEDNITVLAVKIPSALEQPLFMAVADGHGGKDAARKTIEVFDEALCGVTSAPAAPRRPGGSFRH